MPPSTTTTRRGSPKPEAEPLSPIEIKIRLHPGQREVARHRARFKVLACGRRWGKTRLGSALAFQKAAKGGAVWWVAPDFPRATIGWRIIRRLARQVPFCEVHEGERRVEFPNGGWLQVKSAHVPGALRGEGLDYVVVDEAAFVDEERWTSEIRPALADRRGGALFISTFAGENWFFGLWRRGEDGEPGWASWQKPTADNPFIDPAEIEEARSAMGEPEFAQEFLAQPVTAFGTVFKAEWWDAPGTRYGPRELAAFRNASVGRYLALDTANTANENSAYSALVAFDVQKDYRAPLTHVARARLEFPELVDWIVAQAGAQRADLKLRALVVENAASGIQLAQTLKRSAPAWLRDIVVPVNPGRGPDRKERAWRSAAVHMRRGMVPLPAPGPEAPTWLHDYERELFAVPNARYKDQADATAEGVNYLEARHGVFSRRWRYLTSRQGAA